MKILSWNINGIRASKVDLKKLFDSLDADVICLQETKITRDMLDEPTAIIDGYNSYYSYSRKRSGYSGVATYCKNRATPLKAEEGLSHVLKPADLTGSVGHYGNHLSFTDDEIQALDAEGRTVITQHKIRFQDGSEKEVAIINVYCPRFDPEREDRHMYKLRFYALLQTRAEALLDSGSHVVILGDINTTHKEIDHCDPEDEASSRKPSRQWLNQMMWDPGRDPSIDDIIDRNEFIAVTPYSKGGRFIDTFRHLYPAEENAFTNWCTLKNARACNFGRRLDYILGDVDLVTAHLTGAWVLREVEGSDHCPVKMEIQAVPVAANKCPGHCTKFMPEFSGTQQKLSMFFTKVVQREDSGCNAEVKEKDEKDIEGRVGGNVSDTGVCSDTISSSRKQVGGEKLGSGQFGAKRPLEKDNSLTKGQTKKQKTDLKKGTSVGSGKQQSLANFFLKGQSGKSQVKPTNDHVSKYFPTSNNQTASSELVHGQMDAKSDDDSLRDKSLQKLDNHEDVNKDTGTTSLVRDNSKQTASAWKNLLGGLGPAPLCKGHNEPGVLRMVKKPGPNKGKQFYTCARGEGHKDNPEARCDFFKWVTKK